MRPIDADAVSTILTRLIKEQEREDHVDEVIGLMEARTEVNDVPTLDAKPVVHAHWIKGLFGDVNITCSNCNFHICLPDSSIPKMIYCPNCAARMDGEARYETY